MQRTWLPYSPPPLPLAILAPQEREGLLTLQAVGIQQILALLVAFDPTLCAAHPLPCDAPQQPLALVAVGGGGGCPDLKVVGGCAGDGVD